MIVNDRPTTYWWRNDAGQMLYRCRPGQPPEFLTSSGWEVSGTFPKPWTKAGVLTPAGYNPKMVQVVSIVTNALGWMLTLTNREAVLVRAYHLNGHPLYDLSKEQGYALNS